MLYSLTIKNSYNCRVVKYLTKPDCNNAYIQKQVSKSSNSDLIFDGKEKEAKH